MPEYTVISRAVVDAESAAEAAELIRHHLLVERDTREVHCRAYGPRNRTVIGFYEFATVEDEQHFRTLVEERGGKHL